MVLLSSGLIDGNLSLVMRGRKRLSAASRGFTLIELMLSLVIIGLLANLAVPTYRDEVEKSRLASLVVQINAFKDAMKIVHEADEADLTSSTGFNLAEPGNYPANLRDVLARTDIRYDNMRFLYVPVKTATGVSSINIMVMGLNPNGRRSLMNLSEILPDNYYKWATRGMVMLIPLVSLQ
jgi:prepilin-type N-terminal cleavage/methylation domain-containing protein